MIEVSAWLGNIASWMQRAYTPDGAEPTNGLDFGAMHPAERLDVVMTFVVLALFALQVLYFIYRFRRAYGHGTFLEKVRQQAIDLHADDEAEPPPAALTRSLPGKIRRTSWLKKKRDKKHKQFMADAAGVGKKRRTVIEREVSRGKSARSPTSSGRSPS